MQQPRAIARVGDSLPDVLMTVKQLHRPYMLVLNEDDTIAGVITQNSLVATLGSQYVDEAEVI